MRNRFFSEGPLGEPMRGILRKEYRSAGVNKSIAKYVAGMILN
jgi:hypothetical protein